MSKQIKKQTEYYIKDLHARESLRLTWYRHQPNDQKTQAIRVQKAHHRAFLNDLLRRRSLKPIWYATLFYYAGHILGILATFLPRKLVNVMEKTLEFWLLLRYEKYLKKLKLHFDLRSMIEALQMKKINHNEPGTDVLNTLENFIENEKKLLQN